MSDRVIETTVLTRNLRTSGGGVRHSLSDLRQETLISMSGRTCHHCHAPQSDPCHVGIPTGVGHCTLEHWEHCTLQQPDGYDKHKKLWTGCPSLDDTHGDDSDKVTDITVDEGDDEVTVKVIDLPKNVAEAAKLLNVAATASNKDVLEDDSEEETNDEEDRLALEEFEKLKKRVEQNKKQIEADKALAIKVARKEKKQADRLKMEQQRADLLLTEKLQKQERTVTGYQEFTC